MFLKYPQESILEFLATYTVSLAGLIITTAASKSLADSENLAWLMGLLALFGLRLTLSYISQRQQTIIALLQEKDASD
jgi:hypothetical protein